MKRFDTYKAQLAELESPLAKLITENNTQQLEGTAALYEELLEVIYAIQIDVVCVRVPKVPHAADNA